MFSCILCMSLLCCFVGSAIIDYRFMFMLSVLFMSLVLYLWQKLCSLGGSNMLDISLYRRGILIVCDDTSSRNTLNRCCEVYPRHEERGEEREGLDQGDEVQIQSMHSRAQYYFWNDYVLWCIMSSYVVGKRRNPQWCDIVSGSFRIIFLNWRIFWTRSLVLYT